MVKVKGFLLPLFLEQNMTNRFRNPQIQFFFGKLFKINEVTSSKYFSTLQKRASSFRYILGSGTFSALIKT
tara:strand:+ start:281 stop:493 length:213 start_codon:yes stop_codon:yes gene_type:complete